MPWKRIVPGDPTPTPPPLIQLTYVCRSVCRCGYPALREDIPIGTVYVVRGDSVRAATLICGGCGLLQQVATIDAEDDRGEFRPLPLGVFGLYVCCTERRTKPYEVEQDGESGGAFDPNNA